IVDDSPTNRQAISAMLSSFKIRADQAEDGIQALRLCSHRKYDMIFMDCYMTDLNGFETSARIRSDAACINHHTPIIALSAVSETHYLEAGRPAGMDDFLANPLHIEDLAGSINKWMKKPLPQIESPGCELKDESAGIIDLETLTELCNGDAKQVIVLASTFSELLNYEIQRLSEAVRSAGNFSRARRHAATIRNSSQNFRALRLQKAATLLESSCSKNDPNQVAQHLRSVIEENEKLQAAVQQILS
ncbi:MAG: response regulator, partial [Verrucomicrobiota bacterium]